MHLDPKAKWHIYAPLVGEGIKHTETQVAEQMRSTNPELGILALPGATICTDLATPEPLFYHHPGTAGPIICDHHHICPSVMAGVIYALSVGRLS